MICVIELLEVIKAFQPQLTLNLAEPCHFSGDEEPNVSCA